MLNVKEDVSGLIRELAERISLPTLAKETGIAEAELREPETEEKEFTPRKIQQLLRASYKYGFFDLPPAHGVPHVPYDISTSFDLPAPPIGYEEDPPVLPLIERPTTIAGYRVDFPLGLPASVLAANAKWIKFYARRGFDILTYKTVRTQIRKEHPWPNWVFLKDPVEINDPSDPPTIVGYPEYRLEDMTKMSMANSFGVPSREPEWWQEDVRRARAIVREGHQVLIVSVVASTNDTEDAMTADFVKAALLAKKAGADIIEVNYSCPNTLNDRAGDVYQFPEVALNISKALREALDKTPLFVKIGYLREMELRKFVEANIGFIDGIVAINTISTKIVNDRGEPTFPNRSTAGVSGWAIKARAQEVAHNLVTLRKEVYDRYKKNLVIMGLGGVLTKQDCFDYLDKIGVDAVESCTGAFLNPHLGLQVRFNDEAIKNKLPRPLFELKVIGKFLGDIAFNPGWRSRIRVDRGTQGIAIEPE